MARVCRILHVALLPGAISKLTLRENRALTLVELFSYATPGLECVRFHAHISSHCHL